MEISLHKLARTTPATRLEIQQSMDPVSILSKRYGVTPRTIYKWKKRRITTDQSHARHTLLSNLDQKEELMVIALRKDCMLSLDDITEVMNRCISYKTFSRSSIYRCLKRNNMSCLPKNTSTPAIGKFEEITKPGYIHMDVKYLTKLNGKRSYIYVAIDRATRYVYAEILYNLEPTTTKEFIERFIDNFPCKVNIILTDNGFEWTDR